MEALTYDPKGSTLLMKFIHYSAAFRKLMWRLGRKMYTYARGDGLNDPCINGEYWLLEQVLKAPSPPALLFDVGANRGNWTAKSLELSLGVNEIHIHAFEPSLATRSMILDRFKENTSVTVHSYALSEKIGEASFYSDEPCGGTNSLSSVSGENLEIVELITIDQFMQKFGIEVVSMVKIDTEEYDLLVLKGAEKSLQRGQIEIIQFEYYWRWLLNNTSPYNVFDYISSKPYRFGKLLGKTIEFFDEWHFELERYFENIYVLIKRDSELCFHGKDMHFDHSNTAVISETSQLMRQLNVVNS